MKFAGYLLLLGLALDISAAAFLPLSHRDDASGQNPGCYMSSQSQCPFKPKKVGCYKDTEGMRVLPELLLTARDSTSSVYFGENIDWNDWANFIDRFTCECANRTKQNHYDYFGIEYFGECWSGMNPNYMYDYHGESDNCHMIKEDECAFEACNEQRQDSRLCVGGQWALYVYSVKMPTPPPTILPPPPPLTTLPPPPPPTTLPPPPPPTSLPPPPPPTTLPPPPPPTTLPPPPPPTTHPPPPPPTTHPPPPPPTTLPPPPPPTTLPPPPPPPPTTLPPPPPPTTLPPPPPPTTLPPSPPPIIP